MFGTRKALQKANQGTWKDEGEKRALCKELDEAQLSAKASRPLLFSRDAQIRQVGIDAWMSRATPQDVQGLITEMGSQPRHIQAFLSRFFGRLPAQVMDSVVGGLIDSHDAQQVALGWQLALELTGEVGTHFLRRAVQDASPTRQLAALRRLVAESGAEANTEILLGAAQGPNGPLAACAIAHLALSSDPRVMEIMLHAASQEDAQMRGHAVRYLEDQAKGDPARTRARMLELLGQGEDESRHMAVKVLFTTGESTEVLGHILKFACGLTGWLRTRIVETLQTFGEGILQSSLALLSHETEQVRTMALILAERFDDPRIVGPVCGLLDDEDWWIGMSACDTLGRLKDERTIPHLVKALERDSLRWAAVEALSQFNSPKVVKPLAGQLRDPRPEVRLEVVKALAAFPKAQVLKLIQQVGRKDPDPAVRGRCHEVARTLAERLGLEVVAPQLPAFDGDDVPVIDRLLSKARERRASDLHITVDEPPFLRVAGELKRMPDEEVIGADQANTLLRGLLSPGQTTILDEEGQVDLCHAHPDLGRHRVNIYTQRHGLCGAFRLIPQQPPTFADLRLPGTLTGILDHHQGIVVVSGPAGCGKSTTLAALVNLINERKAVHVVTLEDPIEFVHPPKMALINQRSIGEHSASFGRALRGSLREDPDVIIIGEMRDRETITLALEAAETGHLVIASMHTTSAVQTVDRLVGAFPPSEQAQVRMSLSESLKYVVCQRLLPHKDGDRQVALFEVLKGTFNVGYLIRDNKSNQIPSLMQLGRRIGMQTVDQALMELIESDLIRPEVAWEMAETPDDFLHLCPAGFHGDAADDKGEAMTT